MKSGKVAVSVLLCSAMVLTGFMTSFAASYTDMGKHWAESYVKNIKDKQIISGYEDGSFKPDNSVSRLEAIIMISKLFNIEQINQVYSAKKDVWESKLINYKIPDWSWQYVVFAIENNIIPDTDDFLSKIMNQSQKNVQNQAFRYEVIVYMVRALNFEGELAKTAVLKYKDMQTIPVQAIPYIDIMIKKGIIGEKGDQNGNFGAQRHVTRAEMAVMLSNAYQYASQLSPPTVNKDTASAGTNNITDVQPKNTIPSTGTQAVANESLKIMDGTVELVTTVGDDVSFTVSSDTGMFHSFGNKSSMIQIKIGNSVASLSDLKIKDKVKVLYEEGNKARSIIIAERAQNTVENINKTLVATIVDIRNRSLIIDENGKEERYEVADNISITRNGSQIYDIKELGINDKAKIVIENSKITSVEAESVKSRIKSGVIKQILISSEKTQIVVADADNKEYRLDVNRNTQIRFEGKRAYITDLEQGYEVDVYIDGSIIEEIHTDGNYKQSMYMGKVEFNDERDGFIEIKTADGKIIKVYYKNSTEIEDIKTGKSLNARQIYKGDDVTVVGAERLGGLDAERIIVSMQYY